MYFSLLSALHTCRLLSLLVLAYPCAFLKEFIFRRAAEEEIPLPLLSNTITVSL
jgi:hypothetical protein